MFLRSVKTPPLHHTCSIATAHAYPVSSRSRARLRAERDDKGEARAYSDAPDESPLVKAALPVGLALVAGSLLIHAPAWSAFFNELADMKAAMLLPGGQGLEEYNAAVNFFTLFAVAHPLLTPVLWISEVLHACPGPKLGGLVPLSFVALNALAIYVLGQIKPVGTLAASAALALFLGTVGQGLASEGNMAGYNLALNGETPSVVRENA
jgi:hypothetical protein